MTVRELIGLLENQDPNALVYVSCEGYTNYDPTTNKYYECDETTLSMQNGRLYVADGTHIGD